MRLGRHAGRASHPVRPLPHRRGGRLLHDIVVTKFVCTDCGRVEEWVEAPGDLVKIKAEHLRTAAGQ